MITMISLNTSAHRSVLPPAARLHRFTVHQYEQMAGLFEDRGVELIDGYVVEKMGKKPLHVLTVELLRRRLERACPSGWHVRQENPVSIPEFDEPEPDLAVARGSPIAYASRHPGPGDLGLIVEASETTLEMDRGSKREAYARGKVPIYWIVNLVDRQLESHTDPRGKSYRSHRVYNPGQTVTLTLGRKTARIRIM
jgi:Uma2 family endonuclease